MANEFEDGLKDLVSEQFKDGAPMPLRNEETGEFIENEQVEDAHDERVGDREEEAADKEDGGDSDEDADEDEDEDGEEEDSAEGEEEGEEGDEDEPKPKPKQNRAEKRIGKLTSDLKRLERELKAERDQRTAAALVPKKADGTAYTSADEYAKDKLNSDEKAPKKPDASKFKLGEFDNEYKEAYDDYLEARRDYLAAQRDDFKSKSSANANAAPDTNQDKFRSDIDAKIADGKKLFKDFDDVVVKGIANDTWALSEVGAHFMAESEVGAHMAYHLAKNVKLAKEISDLPAVQQVKRLTKLEDKIIADNAEAEKKRKRVSAAPVPISRAKGGGGRETGRFDSEDFEAVERNYNAAQKKKGQR